MTMYATPTKDAPDKLIPRCRYCGRSRLIAVKIITPHGLHTRVAYHCPRCGQELLIKWTK